MNSSARSNQQAVPAYVWGVLIGLLAIVLLISGCGFKLRGAIDLSPELAPVAIERNTAFDLEREIRQILEKNGVAFTEKSGNARTVIKLISESKNRRLLSVDSSGQASEYLLVYKVSYSLKSSAFKETEFTANQQRSLVFDPGAVLAVENESEILYKEMRRDVARLILIRLEALSARAGTN